MLSIKWITDVDYYLNQSTADYYFRPGEPPGVWWGSGAEALGLADLVTAQQLRSLCQGFAPDGRALTQNAGASDHQQAWDLTFSAPKSVSVLWSQADITTRFRIRKLHERAINAALDYLTEVAFLTRRGKGGKVREPARPIVATFEHGSNRELEPLLHSHAVLLNVAARADGTFGTILSEPFYKHKLTAGALYQRELAFLLQTEPGIQIQPEETAFSVVGVPKELVDHWSTRSKQIQDRLRSKGGHSAKAAATAALDTRKSKPHSPPPRATLLKRWQATNEQFGFSTEAAQRLLGKAIAISDPPVLLALIREAVQELLETNSYFSEQQLIRLVAKNSLGQPVSVKEVIDQVRSFLINDQEVVALQSLDHEAQFTTREMLALEQQLLSALEQGKEDTSHVMRPSAINRLLDERLPIRKELAEDELIRNKEQREAVFKLLTQPGNVQVLEGLAGTGKTYALSVAREAWEQAGYRVTGMALSAVAAAKLGQDAGIESTTIALRLMQLDGPGNFARHHKRQLKRLMRGQQTYAYDGSKFQLDRKTIVLVDEAGMNGTRQMAALLKHARKAGAKLVLVGDRRQLQPIEAGGPFAAIADRTDKADLQHVVRQKTEPHDPNPTWHRQAGKLIASGQVAQAVKLFTERGRVTVSKDRDEAILAVARDWSVAGIKNPADHIILAGTKAEVAALNTMCQTARASAGVLGGDQVAVGEQQLRIGDTVLFTKNSRLYQVNNGDRGVIVAFNHHSRLVAVRLHGTAKTVYFPYRDYTALQLGYAMTTHKAQGATVPSVYVLLGGPMQDRHLSYVQTTRASESTRLYVDVPHAGPQLKHLLNQMAKERPKRLASDLAPKNPPPVPPTKIQVDASPTPPTNPRKQPTKGVTAPQTVTPRTSSITANSSPSQKSARDRIRRPLRNLADLSHLQVEATTDEAVLQALVHRYGFLPGGIVIEGEARCAFPITSLAFDPDRQGCLHLNDSLIFETGLSAEEVALIWHAVLDTDDGAKQFGVKTQRQAIGIDNDSIVAVNMMHADNSLGGPIYGYDSQLALWDPFPGCANPFVEEAERLTDPDVFRLLFWNFREGLRPQVLLVINGMSFHATNDGEVLPSSTKATVTLGVVGQHGALTIAGHSKPLVEARFPDACQALERFRRNFLAAVKRCPEMARTLAYAELVSLLRRAKALRAKLSGATHVPELLQRRQSVPIPRYDYTLRSKEYADVARGAAQRLQSVRASVSDTVRTAVLSAHYASMAGDFALFVACQQEAFSSIDRLRAKGEFHADQPDLYRALPEIRERLASCSHDILIPALIDSTVDQRLAKQESDAYLKEAIRICGPESMCKKIPATWCRLVEANCYLDPKLDPASALAKIRASYPTDMQAYWTLRRIKSRRNQVTVLQPTDLKTEIAALTAELDATQHWKSFTSVLDDWQLFVLLNDMRRFGVSIADYLVAAARHKTDNPQEVLLHLLIERLKPTSEGIFAINLVHRRNPFVDCHDLLDLETPDNLSVLYGLVRFSLGDFSAQSREPGLFKKLISPVVPLTPDQWWAHFIGIHAPSSDARISRIGLLLAHEINCRNLQISRVYHEMRRLGTRNPQAALFSLDLEAVRIEQVGKLIK
jgi:conjugative relaxase-like TrwC/TraI family protein